jgi:hypothetical protein
MASPLSTQALASQAAPTDARTRIHETVDRPEIAGELTRLGISPDEAHRRIDALSDAELASIGARLDELPAGQGAVGVIVGGILIVFFVLLLTDLMGATDVFPWVRKH